VTQPVILTVEPSELIAHVSVKAPTAVNVRAEPFGLRPYAHQLALAYGQEQHANGTVDRWLRSNDRRRARVRASTAAIDLR